MIIQKKLLQVLVLFISTVFALAVPAFAQNNMNEQITDSVMTKKGELKIIATNEGNSESVKVELNDRVLTTHSPYIGGSVYGKYPPKLSSVFLIVLTNGSIVCAANFVIVDLSAKNSFVSREFGNCSDTPKTKYRGNLLLINFPEGKDSDTVKVGRAESWEYRNGKLRKMSR